MPQKSRMAKTTIASQFVLRGDNFNITPPLTGIENDTQQQGVAFNGIRACALNGIEWHLMAAQSANA